VRVLYITDSLMLGGVETQLVDLISHLDRDAIEPVVLCLYGPRDSSTHFVEPLRAMGVEVRCLDRLYNLPDKPRIVRDIAGAVHALRPDIVQAENYHSNLLSRAARPLLGRTKLIGTQRTRYTDKQLRYERWSHGMTDVMVASSPHLRDQLVEVAHVPSEKVHVIVNSIDTRRFAQPQQAGLRAHVAPGFRRVLLSLGRISRQKRMHVTVEALGRLKNAGKLPKDVCLLIVGPAQQPPMLAALEEAIARYDLADQVRMFPGTDTPEDWYAAADITMLYTVDEGLSCVMLESLAAGRPVVISEESNGAEVIQHGVQGWVAPTHDLDAFTAQLGDVLALPDDAIHAMQGPCVSRAGAYDIRQLAAAYERLYGELVG
jgi:glycosyltransferase involved in cell wall biosynthesis